jgi:hypothetical protein
MSTSSANASTKHAGVKRSAPSGPSSGVKSEKPYQKQIQTLNAYNRYQKALKEASEVYSQWLTYVFTEVDTEILPPPSKKSKTHFPQKHTKVSNPSSSDSKGDGGGTKTGGETDENHGGQTSTTVMKRPQHLPNAYVAPFANATQNALKVSHNRLKGNKQTNGHYLGRNSEAFLQDIVRQAVAKPNKYFKINERIVLASTDATLSKLERTGNADAVCFAKRMRQVLNHIHATLARVTDRQRKERQRKKQEREAGTAPNEDESGKGKSSPHAYVADELQKTYGQHLYFQPHGFTQYLSSIVPQGIQSVQKPAILLLDLITSAFIYHLTAVFGCIYSTSDKSQSEEAAKQARWARSMGNSFFLTNQHLRAATNRVQVFPQDEYEAMKAIPLFKTMHEVWSIPMHPLPVNFRSRKWTAKTRRRKQGENGEENDGSHKAASSRPIAA